MSLTEVQEREVLGLVHMLINAFAEKNANAAAGVVDHLMKDHAETPEMTELALLTLADHCATAMKPAWVDAPPSLHFQTPEGLPPWWVSMNDQIEGAVQSNDVQAFGNLTLDLIERCLAFERDERDVTVDYDHVLHAAAHLSHQAAVLALAAAMDRNMRGG